LRETRRTGLQLLDSRPPPTSANGSSDPQSPIDKKPFITNGAHASGSGSATGSGLGSVEGDTIDAVDIKPKPEPIGGEQEEDEDEMSDDWKTIYRFAQASITRGEYTIVGNTRSIIEAQEVLYHRGEDREKGDELMREWFKKHDPVDDDEEEEDDKRWVCPDCKSVI
jgi:hypothetical protein